jgi:hypothetical protein
MNVKVLAPAPAVLLAACVSRARPQAIYPRQTADSSAIAVRQPETWTEAATADDLLDRRVYVRSAWRNVSNVPITLRIHFDLYSKDGRQVGSCDADAEVIRPGEAAWTFCQAARGKMGILAARRSDFQITSQVAELRAELQPLRRRLTDSARIEDSGIRRSRDAGSDEVLPWIRVRALDRTVDAQALFRLYDSDSIQVTLCRSDVQRFPQGVLLLVAGGYAPCEFVPHHFGSVNRVDIDWLVSNARTH